MPVSYDRNAGANQIASGGTTLAITTSTALAAGEFLVVAAGCQSTAGTDIVGVPTLTGVTFTQIYAAHDSKFASAIWVAPVTSTVASGGTITVPMVSGCTSRAGATLVAEQLDAGNLVGNGTHSGSGTASTTASSGTGTSVSNSFSVGWLATDGPSTDTVTNTGSTFSAGQGGTAGTGTTALRWRLAYLEGSGTPTAVTDSSTLSNARNSFDIVASIPGAAVTAAAAVTLTATGTGTLKFPVTASGAVALTAATTDALQFPVTATGTISLTASATSSTVGSTATSGAGFITLSASASVTVTQGASSLHYFTPPSSEYSYPSNERLWMFFRSAAHGISVIRWHDGTFTAAETVTTDEEAEADFIYYGGHEYQVDDDEAAALTTAGYGAGLRDVADIPPVYPPPGPALSDSGYGSGGYGDVGYGA